MDFLAKSISPHMFYGVEDIKDKKVSNDTETQTKQFP